jgi:hypothetical protein
VKKWRAWGAPYILNKYPALWLLSKRVILKASDIWQPGLTGHGPYFTGKEQANFVLDDNSKILS